MKEQGIGTREGSGEWRVTSQSEPRPQERGRGGIGASPTFRIPNSEETGCTKAILRNKAKKFFIINKRFPQKPKATSS